MKAEVSVHNRLAATQAENGTCFPLMQLIWNSILTRDTALPRRGLLEGRTVSCFSVVLRVHIGPLDILTPQEVSGTLPINKSPALCSSLDDGWVSSDTGQGKQVGGDRGKLDPHLACKRSGDLDGSRITPPPPSFSWK